VTAEVTIAQPAVLREEALRVLDAGTIVILGPADDGDVPAGRDPRQEVAESSAAALQWVVEPTAGLAELLEAGAFWITDLDLSVEEMSPVECRVRWTVTVKLRDVGALRAAALAASPAGAVLAPVEVRHSVEAAWNRAANPYAPLREVPGISWTGRAVTVEQVLARAGRSG
jgi:hypothetical protein